MTKPKKETWPQDGAIVWITNKAHVCLSRVDTFGGAIFPAWVYFDGLNTNGVDYELKVNADNATHWAFAELPDLPG